MKYLDIFTIDANNKINNKSDSKITSLGRYGVFLKYFLVVASYSLANIAKLKTFESSKLPVNP